MTEPAAAGEEACSRGILVLRWPDEPMSRWADCCILVVR